MKPHPHLVAVDVALISAYEGALHSLLIRRSEEPFCGQWALPGGLVGADEDLDSAAARVLRTKAGVEEVFIEQLYTFGDLLRDPRSRVIAVAYFALVDAALFQKVCAQNGHRAVGRLVVPWSGETGGPVEVVDESSRSRPLAFDHDQILGLAVKRLRGRLGYSPIGFQLLPDRFSLKELQDIHETVSDRKLNKDSFRRRMLASGQLEATGISQRSVDHRPAQLYRFTQRSAL